MQDLYLFKNFLLLIFLGAEELFQREMLSVNSAFNLGYPTIWTFTEETNDIVVLFQTNLSQLVHFI